MFNWKMRKHHRWMFILVDAESQIRGYYAGLSPEAVAKLIKDVFVLLDEQFPGRGEELVEVSIPEDVREVAWLDQRAEHQKEQASAWKVPHEFQYRDERESSGCAPRRRHP